MSPKSNSQAQPLQNMIHMTYCQGLEQTGQVKNLWPVTHVSFHMLNSIKQKYQLKYLLVIIYIDESMISPWQLCNADNMARTGSIDHHNQPWLYYTCYLIDNYLCKCWLVTTDILNAFDMMVAIPRYTPPVSFSWLNDLMISPYLMFCSTFVVHVFVIVINWSWHFCMMQTYFHRT